MATQLALAYKAERVRLSDQCALILGRLQAGRVSNRELSQMALNYRARISELRKMGHDIRVVFHDRASGHALYGLFVQDLEWRIDIE